MFAAASASSPPTDWRNYDTIYTERYMWIPQENKDGYDAGTAMTYAKNLKGRLMLYYGTADNNVHPSNTMQLIPALQRAGKSFELQVGPGPGPPGLNHAADDGVLHREPRDLAAAARRRTNGMFSGEEIASLLERLGVTHVVTVPDSTIGPWQSEHRAARHDSRRARLPRG